MKTKYIEIFQTLRAQLQPYTAIGFFAKVNTDSIYVLWTEQLNDVENEKIEIRCFAALEIVSNGVILSLSSLHNNLELLKLVPSEIIALMNERNELVISFLSDLILAQITDLITIVFTYFKQNGWV